MMKMMLMVTNKFTCISRNLASFHRHDTDILVNLFLSFSRRRNLWLNELDKVVKGSRNVSILSIPNGVYVCVCVFLCELRMFILEPSMLPARQFIDKTDSDNCYLQYLSAVVSVESSSGILLEVFHPALELKSLFGNKLSIIMGIIDFCRQYTLFTSHTETPLFQRPSFNHASSPSVFY